MDIAEKSPVEYANEGSWLELKEVDGSPMMYDTGKTDDKGSPIRKQVRILLAGIDGDAWQQADSELSEWLGENAQKNRKPTSKDFARRELERLAAVFLDWEGVEENKKPLQCVNRNAIRLMEWGPFIADQVKVFISNRANFMKA